MTNYYSADIGIILSDSQRGDRMLQEIDRCFTDKTKDFYFYGRLVWEVYISNDNQDSISRALDTFVDKLISAGIKVVLFVNSVNETQPVFLKLSHKVDLVFVDYFLWRVYNEVVLKQKCEISTEWNRNATKFLFLTGKPNKIHRLRLLYKLSRAKLLNSAVWSLLLPENLNDVDRTLIPELSELEFFDFLKTHESNPDDISPDYQARGELHYGGLPYNVELYKNSLFRLVSETYFFTSDGWVPWITEKTWLTILNRLPFIMAGDTRTLDRLEQKGFKGFAEYQRIPDYNYCLRPREENLDLIVHNVEQWISNMEHKDQIQRDVEHNYHRFIELAKINQQKINNAIKTPGITCDDVIPTCDDVTKF